jgi:tetratricopeptide (TPR) repeat protein
MPAPEYAVYNNAMTQTTPQAKAAGLEQYLTQFPQSAVKQAVLETLMVLYYSFDQAKALDAADRLLQIDPANLKGLLVETALRNGQAGSVTDPAAKQTAMDTAAGYAQKGLAAPQPKCMPDADFTALKNSAYPTFYSAIGYDALLKKDSATAIDNYKKELAMVPPDATKTPGSVLQDIFYLGEAYYQSTPPDYLNCTFYTSRAVAYAPDQYKAVFSPTAKYCYRKFHGADDGYDAVLASATANLNPPDGFLATIKPAPTPADIVNQVIASTQDLSTLATGDKEFILQNGTPDQAAKVWDTVKGKSFQFPDVLVIASTPTQVQVAISDDAVQAKTADFTFNLKAPEDLPEHATLAQKNAYKKKQDAIAAAIAPGQKVTLSGTFDSYTPKPIMITMTDGDVVLPKAAAPKAAPAHTTHRPAATH